MLFRSRTARQEHSGVTVSWSSHFPFCGRCSAVHRFFAPAEGGHVSAALLRVARHQKLVETASRCSRACRPEAMLRLSVGRSRRTLRSTRRKHRHVASTLFAPPARAGSSGASAVRTHGRPGAVATAAATPAAAGNTAPAKAVSATSAAREKFATGSTASSWCAAPSTACPAA